MNTKPKLSFWQIWNMSFGFLGIQFGFALQNANVSRIFETLGANVDKIPILWIAAPVTGLVVQPIIGHWSDNTWGRLGRRRPFFLVGAILASIALIMMPNSPTWWIAAGMLWIMDASINISMEPFRAFVGDMLPDEQRTRGFAMQSFFIGIGAVVGSFLPYVLTNIFGIPNTAPEGEIPLSVIFSFYLGSAVFILAVGWTVFRTKEYSPEELEKFESAKKSDKEEPDKPVITSDTIRTSFRTGIILLLTGIILTLVLSFIHVEKEVYILAICLGVFGILEIISAIIQSGKKTNGLVAIFNDLNAMPKTMKQLAIVQFFSWFALFAMWIYTTAGVTSDKYDMTITPVINSDLHSILGYYPIPDTAGLSNDKKEEIVEKGKEYSEITKELKRYDRKFEEGNKKAVISTSVMNFFLSNKTGTKKHIRNIIYRKSKEDESFKKKVIKLQDIKNIEEILKKKSIEIQLETVKLLNTYTWDEETKIQLNAFERLKYIQKEYNEGANWVGVCFSVYNGLAAIFAFLLMYLARITNRKITHMISLFVGGVSFISIFFIQDPIMLLIPFIGIGLAWASILAMPYAILTGALPAKKMGIYMGIFNFFIVIPQILAASILGFLVKSIFDEQAIYAMVLGGISFGIASVVILFVDDSH
jgi:maltose/moltooligosaccharide transporter